MINQFFDSLEGALAPNTIRAYRSDFAHYSDWCLKNQYDAFNRDEEQFSQYIKQMGDNLTTATIRRRVASLSSIFTLMSKPNPTKSPCAVLTLKRLHRKLGRAQKQATPLTHDILKKLVAVCNDDLRGLRNRVLLQLGYETMRRRSELCGFHFDDLRHFPNRRHAIYLKTSKTDQYGEGRLIPVSESLVQLIDDWKKASGSSSGHILRGFYRGNNLREKLNPSTINQILKNLQQKANLSDLGELSGHSFRVGGAIDLLQRGVPLERIMLRGGWKSADTAMRYLRSWQELDAFDLFEHDSHQGR